MFCAPFYSNGKKGTKKPHKLPASDIQAEVLPTWDDESLIYYEDERILGTESACVGQGEELHTDEADNMPERH